MKTTVEIEKSLLAAIRRLALKEKATLRSLIEEGLRRVLVRASAPSAELQAARSQRERRRPATRVLVVHPARDRESEG
jgi:hypothetical protein